MLIFPMLIKSFSEVMPEDRIFCITLANKSRHLCTYAQAEAISKMEAGTIAKLPSGDYINKSHIVEVVFDPSSTGAYVKSNKAICDKYGIAPNPDMHFDFKISEEQKFFS